jgi:chaperone required for assembly of F1-ATPase|tara:strand:+ start:210 stop:911 length:702 start_codon:yes stop_codon:yes gene_type:complete
VKRFWKEATLRPVDGGWQVWLDERAVKSRGGAPQVAPTRSLGELLRAEWADAGEEIAPEDLPLRDLADRAIDTARAAPEPIIARLLGFADGDTLCYRAEPDEAIAHRQTEVWEPIVARIEADLGIQLARTHGILHRPQPEASLSAIRDRLETQNAFALVGLDIAASLAASLCIALAGLDEDADAQALWGAANLEQDWQAERWGFDEEALARRNEREAEFTKALAFARAARAAD